MPSARRSQTEPLDDEERAALEAQTRRNLDGMELEQAGHRRQAAWIQPSTSPATFSQPGSPSSMWEWLAKNM